MTYLSIAPAESARVDDHGRTGADRSAGGRRLRGHLQAVGRRRTAPTSIATRTTCARAKEIFARLENEDVRLPSGDRLTARRFRQLGMLDRLRAGTGDAPPRCSSCHSASNAFLSDAEAGRRLASATRSMPRSTRRATPMAAPRAGPRRGCSRLSSSEQDVLHRRAHLPVDVRGLRRAPAAAARRRSSSPSASGRACTTRTSWPTTRCPLRPRSTSTTCTSIADFAQRDGSLHSRPAGRGSPTSTSTTASRVDPERVFGRLHRSGPRPRLSVLRRRYSSRCHDNSLGRALMHAWYVTKTKQNG